MVPFLKGVAFVDFQTLLLIDLRFSLLKTPCYLAATWIFFLAKSTGSVSFVRVLRTIYVSKWLWYWRGDEWFFAVFGRWKELLAIDLQDFELSNTAQFIHWETKKYLWKIFTFICVLKALLLTFILLYEKFLQFDWLRAVVFQLNLKYLHVKITNLLRVVV